MRVIVFIALLMVVIAALVLSLSNSAMTRTIDNKCNNHQWYCGKMFWCNPIVCDDNMLISRSLQLILLIYNRRILDETCHINASQLKTRSNPLRLRAITVYNALLSTPAKCNTAVHCDLYCKHNH